MNTLDTYKGLYEMSKERIVITKEEYLILLEEGIDTRDYIVRG